MSRQAHIIELTEQDFPDALRRSYQVPVLVEFLGAWSGPCVLLAEHLTSLAQEFAGQFLFAKVDVDEQPALREQYDIAHVPTLLVLRDGEEVRRKIGDLREAELHDLLKEFGIFRLSDELREQARQRHIEGDDQNAIQLLTEAIDQDPDNVRAPLDLVQVLLDTGEQDRAKALFDRLPDTARDSELGKAVSGQLLFVGLATATEGIDALAERLQQDPDDHGARFDLALCEVARREYPAAMEQLFAVLEVDPDFHDGAARELIATIADMLMPNEPELAEEYRHRLGSLPPH